MAYCGIPIGVLLVAFTVYQTGLAEINGLYPILVPPSGFDLPSKNPATPIPSYCSDKPLITMEIFLDLLCDDSRTAWKSVLELAKLYPPAQLVVRVYMFPLPYHRHAMTCSQVLLMIREQVPEQLVPYVNMVYEHLDDWSNSAIVNRTDNELLVELADLTEQLTGVTAESVRRRSDEWNRRARAEWKLGALRGVAGTPTVFVNGVPLHMGDDVSVESFREFLDRLMALAGPVGGGVELVEGSSSPSSGSQGGAWDGPLAASSARSIHGFW